MFLEDRGWEDVSHSPFGGEFERYENYRPDLEQALSILYKVDQVLTDNGFEVEEGDNDFYYLGQDRENWPENLSERIEPVTPIKESDINFETEITQEGDAHESERVTTVGFERYSLEETPERLLGIQPVDFIINYSNNENSYNLTVPQFGEEYSVGINTHLEGYSIITKEEWSEDLIELRDLVKENGENRFTKRDRERYLSKMKEAPRKTDLERARENAVDRIDGIRSNLENDISFNPDADSLMLKIKPESDLSSISDDFNFYTELARDLEDLTCW